LGRTWTPAVALAAAALVLLLVTTVASAVTPNQRADMQRIVEQYREAADYPGLVVGVWRKGDGGFTTAVGKGNLRTGKPIETRDRFHIASETKTMTATLVLQLVQRGRLTLHEPVSDFVHGIPLGRLITVRMLLNHTSGIPTGPGPGIQRKIRADIRRGFSPANLIRSRVRAPRCGFPGDVWCYSDTGYWLLGQIIKKVTHKPLRRLYEDRLFDRLGMRHTAFRPQRRVPRPAAHGYIAGHGGTPQDVTHMNWSWAWAAGGVTSTLGDLRRWVPSVATGRGVLNRRTQKRRLRFVDPGLEGIFSKVRYGLGAFKWPLPSGAYYGHNGEGPGYDTEAFYAPGPKVTIVALGNTSAGEDPVEPRHIDRLGLNGIVPLLAAAATDDSGSFAHR
jgi:D-alanyl-D-alanine carboxypeptidase